MKECRLFATVYLEDTDAQGIVYHANYLKYCERGRTELLKANGYSLGAMQRRGILYVVFEMRLRFQQPARLHDELEIHTMGMRTSDYRITFNQKVFGHGSSEPLFVAESVVVAIDNEWQLLPIPEDLLVD